MNNDRRFTFFENYSDILSQLTDEQAGQLMKAICASAFNGEEVELDGLLNAVLMAVLPSVKKSIAVSDSKNKYEGKRNSSSSEKKNTKVNSSPEKTSRKSVSSSERLEEEIEIDIDKEEKKERKKKEKPKTQNPRFVPPSLSEIEDYFTVYATEKGYAIDNTPAKFFNFYTSNGWKVGKNAMKDWKAALRGWIARDKSEKSNVQALENNPCPAYGVDWSKEGWGNVYTG